MQETSSFDIVKATQYGKLTRVQKIVEDGFDLNTKDAFGDIAFHIVFQVPC